MKGRLRRLRKLAASASVRKSEGVVLVEGAMLCQEALQSGMRIREVFVETSRLDHAGRRLADLAEEEGAEIWNLQPGALSPVRSSSAPQPLLAVFDRPHCALPGGARFVLAAAGVSDPGNAGTLIRCAEGAGADAVLFAGACADPFGPKAVRASAGSVFRLPVHWQSDPDAALEEMDSLRLRRVGTAVGRGLQYELADLSPPLALVVGNESHGVPPAWEKGISEWVHILLDGQAESLNVGAAAAVLCFEVRRRLQSASGDSAGSHSAWSHAPRSS